MKISDSQKHTFKVRILLYDSLHMKFKTGMNTYLVNRQKKMKGKGNRNSGHLLPLVGRAEDGMEEKEKDATVVLVTYYS